MRQGGGAGFALRLAWREGRSGLRRLVVYMGSIALGVGALVALHSFRADVTRSIDQEARALLGADLSLSANRPLPDSVTAIVDSLVAAGAEESRVVTLLSMVAAPDGTTRLFQVWAVEGGYPLYGDPAPDPAGSWPPRPRHREAVVDPAVLVQLGVAPGDSLSIGATTVAVAGTVADLPTDLGFQTAVGPRVFVPATVLPETGLLGFGSLSRHRHYLRLLGDEETAEEVEERYEAVFRATGVSVTTAEEEARDLTRAVDTLTRYLGLVGLGALLLGGIGVASAIHVFVREKLTTVAVLRCIGATQGAVFSAYLLQAAALGLLGALAGVVLGVAAQHLLPGLLVPVLPVEVTPRLALLPVAAGLATGVWVALVFALLPLLRVRGVPPLRALRRDVEVGEGPSRTALAAAWAALAASVLLLALLEAPSAEDGVAFAAGLVAAGGLLWAVAAGLMRATRRWFPARASYPVRQGVANLFRPQNQTVAVTLALGFGALVVSAVLLVQRSLVDGLAIDDLGGEANLLLFDVQADQREGVADLLARHGGDSVRFTPIVPARIAAVGGRPAADILSDTAEGGPSRWAVRREYRNTWRADPGPSEVVVEGEWWDGPEAGGLPRISMEADLAEDLRVGVGDRITWDVGGRSVETRVTSLRTVDWARFEPNFFVVFEPGVLEGAPGTFVALQHVEGSEARAAFQRDLVRAHPNVSVLDLSRIQEAVGAILERVSQAIRFLAVFSAAAGLLVLAGALSTSRFQRMREGALLKTLGARRGQVLGVLLAEYVALGVLSSLAGLLLGVAAAWLLVRGTFEMDLSLSPPALLLVGLGLPALTVVVGILNSRGVLGKPPLPVLRESAE